MELTIFLIGLFSALPLFVIAYLVGVRKRLALINGLDPKRVVDPDRLARFAGIIFALLGTVTLLACTGLAFVNGHDNLFGIGLTAAIAILTILMVLGIQRQLKPGR